MYSKFKYLYGDKVMCGGSGISVSAGSISVNANDYSAGSISSTHYQVKREPIGLGLVHVKYLKQDKAIKEHIEDSYIQANTCWGKYYSQTITEQDLDITKLTLQNDSPLEQAAKDLIGDRREYMRRKSQKDQTINKNHTCNIL
jgi:hypothetical protein